MENTVTQYIKNILSLSEEKLSVLKEFLGFLNKIKEEACSGKEDAPENIAALADLCGNLVEKIQNIDLTLRHYSAEIGEINNKMPTNGLQKGKLSEIQTDINKVLADIKIADAVNSEKISLLMKELQEKYKAAKEKRILIDKFTNREVSESGTLLDIKK